MSFAPDSRQEPVARTSTAISSIGARDDRPSHDAMQEVDVAKFEGSFAPNARPSAPSLGHPWYRNRDYFLGGWLVQQHWKAAVGWIKAGTARAVINLFIVSQFIEGVGTSFLVYVSGVTTATLISYNTVQLGAYIGLSNVFLISVFIYATAAMTGGHLNPMITFSSIVAGICPLSRGFLYLCAQTLGAALGGGILAGVFGRERSIQVHGGGCFFDPAEISSGQVFLNEFFASFALLFLSYGVGLDPRQALLFGPRFGPLLVGSSLGLITFATSSIAPGYAGAQMNPARCFAYGIARRDLSGQWIWWFGPASAALLQSLVYNFAPPHGQGKGRNASQTSLPTHSH